MLIFPAIDLFNSQVVRLFKGDYDNMTVYDKDPINTALKFKSFGANWIHIVDLEGAKLGHAVNYEIILKIKQVTNLKCELGGGIRDLNTIENYILNGIDRIILGTVAVNNPELLNQAVKNFGEKIAVGVDIKNNCVAVKGWLENSNLNAYDFCLKMRDAGIKNIISTDISRDGTMTGANLNLYENLNKISGLNITASGGVNSLDDINKLANLKIYGAIVGKAYYTGAINIKSAIEVAHNAH